MIRPLVSLIGATALACGVAHAEEQDRFAAVQIKTHHVSGVVHMLEGAGGNIGVSVGDDGTLIVDDQFAELAGRIQDALEALGGDRPRIILNTHFHFDHTGSSPEFGRTGTIIAHDNVRARLLTTPDFAASGLPLVTYADGVTIHFNGDTLKLMHLPSGHTDGDSVVWWLKANVVHMGDHFFNGRFPFVDVASGGNVDGFIANMEKVLSMVPEDARIIPGHGPLADTEDLKANIETLKVTVARIRAGLAQGQAVEAVAASLNADYAVWGSGFINAERWVRIVEASPQ